MKDAKKTPRDLVVGESYSMEDMKEMFGEEFNEDTRIMVGKREPMAYTVMRALPMQRAKDLDFWREDLDFHFADDFEILVSGAKCDNQAWNHSCGCVRALSGINSLKASTVWYLDRLTIEQLQEAYDNSAYVKEWKADFETFVSLVNHDEIAYTPDRVTVARIVGGKSYTVDIESIVQPQETYTQYK